MPIAHRGILAVKLTADIRDRFATAQQLDQQVKALAAERGVPVSADMYQQVLDGEMVAPGVLRVRRPVHIGSFADFDGSAMSMRYDIIRIEGGETRGDGTLISDK